MDTITMKYTVESMDKYLLLVQKAYEQFADFGLDIYTCQAKHEIYITYPTVNYDDAVGNLELDLANEGELTAEEQGTPLVIINEPFLNELSVKADKAEKAIKDKDDFYKYWISARDESKEAQETNCRIKKQVQAIALLMNSIFPQED